MGDYNPNREGWSAKRVGKLALIVAASLAIAVPIGNYVIDSFKSIAEEARQEEKYQIDWIRRNFGN